MSWFPAPDRLEESTCSCGAPLVWTTGARGGRLCLDRRHRRRVRGVLLMQAHWVHCPHAERHRARVAARDNRPCRVRGCVAGVARSYRLKGRPLCPSCWHRVPESVKRWLRRTWREGKPAREYGEALQAACVLSARARDAVRPAQEGLFDETPTAPLDEH